MTPTTDTRSDAGVDAPTKLTKPTWRYVGRRTVREFLADQCLDVAAALTFYGILAIFPALIALLSLVGLFGQAGPAAQAMADTAEQLGVPSADTLVRPTLEALGGSSAGPGLALALGLATALWSASGYVGAFGRGMNRIFEIEEGRPFWKLRPMLLLVTLVAVAMAALVALALVLTGPAARAVGAAFGFGDAAVTAWSIAKWPVIAMAVVVIIAILYYATPNIDQPRFRWISIGAVFAIAVWVLASVLFGLYVANFGSYDRTYGAMASVVVFLVWLWITNIALLFGAELDSELERGRELQAGLPAEDELQRPPRDDRKIRKDAERDEQERRQGRALRETRGRRDEPAGPSS